MTEEQLDDGSCGNASDTEHSVLVLGRECTIRHAVDLKNQLMQHLDKPEPLFIDGSGVEKADTAGVQLLVAFSLDCMERGIGFGWPGRSKVLENAISSLGVTPLLECPGQVPLPPATHSTADS